MISDDVLLNLVSTAIPKEIILSSKEYANETKLYEIVDDEINKAIETVCEKNNHTIEPIHYNNIYDKVGLIVQRRIIIN